MSAVKVNFGGNSSLVLNSSKERIPVPSASELCCVRKARTGAEPFGAIGQEAKSWQ